MDLLLPIWLSEWLSTVSLRALVDLYLSEVFFIFPVLLENKKNTLFLKIEIINIFLTKAESKMVRTKGQIKTKQEAEKARKGEAKKPKKEKERRSSRSCATTCCTFDSTETITSCSTTICSKFAISLSIFSKISTTIISKEPKAETILEPEDVSIDLSEEWQWKPLGEDEVHDFDRRPPTPVEAIPPANEEDDENYSFDF